VAGLIPIVSDVNPGVIVSTPGYWKNGTWNGLTPLDETMVSRVAAFAVSGGDVYAAGYSQDSFRTMVAGYWKNGTWNGLTPLGTPPPSSGGYLFPSEVHALVVSGSDVYAAGYSTKGSIVCVPGYWKNGTWNGLSPLDATKDSMVFSLVVSGGDVYAAGYSTNSSYNLVPGYWKNGNWIGLTPLYATGYSVIYAIAVSNGDVYAAGENPNGLGTSVPGYWKNGVWNGLTPPSSADYSVINALVVSGNDVYAAGFSVTATQWVPGYWKNGIWNGLTPLDPAGNSTVSAFVLSGGDVYAAGICTTTVGASRTGTSVEVPGYWKNGTWNSLTLPNTPESLGVTAIVVQ
jgi:hypothetical protein